ncbi:siderophore-interacting protein [Streptomyces zaomyceticus]|uniref:siderophore-interacting protein n=1 Tax=Streptomyces zaomyceticus TaxID=68286 RepID=UPI0035DF860E
MPQPSPRSEPAHAPAPLPLRLLRVIATRLVTPRMRRVTLGGSDLGGFTRWYAAYSALPEATRPWMRSYTLRAHDPAAGTADIDGVDRGALHRVLAPPPRPGRRADDRGPRGGTGTPGGRLNGA